MITEDIAKQVDSVSEEIWSSMVNIPVTLAKTLEQFVQPTRSVTSSVQIIGSLQGAVRIDMGADLARQATASLIGAEPTEISHDDVRDAAGELANMTAGGIMELLPQPCQMSLPTVVMGTDFEMSVPQGVVLYSSVFDTPYGKFSVTVLRGEDHGQRLQHEKSCTPEVLRPGAVN
jgi:chemotaxis protein CheX